MSIQILYGAKNGKYGIEALEKRKRGGRAGGEGRGRRTEDKSGRGSPGADILADLTNFSSYFAKVPSTPTERSFRIDGNGLGQVREQKTTRGRTRIQKSMKYRRRCLRGTDERAICQKRQGCVHGEELAYVFGAPLVGGMSHFARNYTKAEVLLSEATMMYWSNFARTGNPNEPQESDVSHVLRQERSRFKNIEWAPYERVLKKYLSLDLKPKLKNHYRAHRLSFWLNLVPDLHKPGGDDVPPSHHLLHDEVKGQGPITTSKHGPDPTASVGFDIYPSVLADHNSSLAQPPLVVVAPSSSERGNHEQEDGFTAYSTALSAIIAIGCSLLLLNALVFAGVYYRRDKRQAQNEPAHAAAKKRNENGGPMANICVTGGATELLQIMETRPTAAMPAPILKQSSEITSGSATLPRAPPPPKTPRPPESQPLLPHTATLGRKPKQPLPEELRV
ncbi:unnamed protein product [Nezara viridula]|uniref:Carboxylesterase type B domain-containing protein n=1 Tax=Nezara viridula TaxID=85310 RepID=A0A9P0HL99_NEZVI|nr:unnamed protein product [Nezara viridula]